MGLGWDGVRWKVVPSPNAASLGENLLTDVAALSAQDVWAVGASMVDEQNQAVQTLVGPWDGVRWRIVPS
jgi:hypothetical protein